MSRIIKTTDGLTTYKVGVPFLIWRPSFRRLDGVFDKVYDVFMPLLSLPRVRLFAGGVYYALFVVYWLLKPVVAGLEWTLAAVSSAFVWIQRLIRRRPFSVHAELVGYIGGQKPRAGIVTLGPRDRPLSRPVHVRWEFDNLGDARAHRQELCDRVGNAAFSGAVSIV